MSVKWIKDVDSGELFPITDEKEDFDIPEHLRVSEHTVVDYEKTAKNTISDLQEQLIAAQEQIDVYKNVQAVELSKEIHDEIQQQSTLNDKPKHFAIDKSWILIIVLCIVGISAMILFFKISYDNGYRFVENSSGNYVFTDEAVEADDETEESEEEGFEQFSPIIGIVLSVLCVKFATRFMLHTLRGA